MTPSPKTRSMGSNEVDRLIVFHAEIHAAIMLADENHRCAIDDALDYITKLEDSTQDTAARSKVEKRIGKLMQKIEEKRKEGWVYGALEGVCKPYTEEIWLLSWVFPELAPPFVKKSKAEYTRMKAAAIKSEKGMS